MALNRIQIVFGIAFAGLVLCGCRKSEAPAPRKENSPPPATAPATAPAPAPLSSRDVSRVHWLGKQWITSRTNAATLPDIWRLPASAQLEAQTLDRLSLAPWRLLKGDAATNGAPAALLRPLLQDLIEQEVYLEVYHPSNQPAEFALAVHVDAGRAALWRTNLATVAESLTGTRPAPAADGQGWTLNSTNWPRPVALTRAGDWTVLALSADASASLTGAVSRVEAGRAAFGNTSADNFLAAELDLSKLAMFCSLNLATVTNLPLVSLRLSETTSNVVTTAELDFPQPLPFTIEPWKTPTNLIKGPLHSFTAVQGIKSCVASSAFWKKYGDGEAPDQAFFWAQQPAPFLTFFAAPLGDPAKAVTTFAQRVEENSRPWFSTHRSGHLDWLPEIPEFRWGGLLLMSPFVKVVEAPEGKFVAGGIASSSLKSPPPQAIMQEFANRTNAVYYDREMTGARADGWLYVGQTIRLSTYAAQLPGDSASVKWLQAAAPKLLNSTTWITLNAPNRLAFARESSLGLTSIELHLLAEWLESPTFPVGLHSLVAPPMSPPRH